MEKVHIFISTGRFHAFEEMRAFIDQTYTDDGDGIPSPCMEEVGLSDYEPGCIEAIRSDHPVPLRDLLANASYADQWRPHLPESETADAAICVYEPNQVEHPNHTSLKYIGAFDYEP